MKTNLPVILLKGIILLPNNALKIEVESNYARQVVDTSSMFHDNKVLIVTQLDPLEEAPNICDLPKFGVIASISQKLELPNNKLRLVLNGITRARVYEYIEYKSSDSILESIVSPLEEETLETEEEEILVHKLKKEIDKYIEEIPYIGNAMVSRIQEENGLNKLTDIVAQNISLEEDRLREYLFEISSIRRVEMILEDFCKEFDAYNVEKELDMKVSQNLDEAQKEIILREKIKAIREELGDISNKDDEIESLRSKANNPNIPDNVKEIILEEISKYDSLPSISPEISNVREYIDLLLELPWNKYSKDNDDLNSIKAYLDKSHYGMKSVKERIVEYIAVNKKTNSLNGPILCFVGPSGVGKTTFVSEVAASLNREFVKLSLGGVHDEAEIRGHRKTYLGASPGNIISLIKKAKVSNPVFLIDEVDKITSDTKGDPASALLEVLDPSQNKSFVDHYLDIEYDLSQVMFMLTANNIEDIPIPLRDRLEIIELSGYTEYEKLEIVNNHLLPRICKNHGLKKINIDNDTILEIINNYTKESGVRELDRQLSKIARKIVVQNYNSKKKIVINKNNLKDYLGNSKNISNKNVYTIGVINGLAYTVYGGDILPIETNYYKGKGNLILTGSLGEVMKESASIALSYIKANYDTFKIKYNDLINNDIHIHAIEGAIKKDGPSAGVTLVTSIISKFTNMKVDSNIAMTGEITLNGNILPVGGIKEKVIGAYRNNINTIFIPESNKIDLEDIPDIIKNNIKFIYVNNYMDIYNYLLGEI